MKSKKVKQLFQVLQYINLFQNILLFPCLDSTCSQLQYTHSTHAHTWTHSTHVYSTCTCTMHINSINEYLLTLNPKQIIQKSDDMLLSSFRLDLTLGSELVQEENCCPLMRNQMHFIFTGVHFCILLCSLYLEDLKQKNLF